MPCPYVSGKIGVLICPVRTVRTVIWANSSMSPHVSLKIPSPAKGFATENASVIPASHADVVRGGGPVEG